MLGLKRFNLKAFKTTDTELNDIAPAAIIGLRSGPPNRCNTPRQYSQHIVKKPKEFCDVFDCSWLNSSAATTSINRFHQHDVRFHPTSTAANTIPTSLRKRRRIINSSPYGDLLPSACKLLTIFFWSAIPRLFIFAFRFGAIAGQFCYHH